MLKNLSIKNYALIEDLNVDFNNGSTKNTVEAIRNGTYREAILETKSPMDTGLCTYQDLEKALNRAKNKKDREEAKAKSLAEAESN